jgi:hypothetical protein
MGVRNINGISMSGQVRSNNRSIFDRCWSNNGFARSDSHKVSELNRFIVGSVCEEFFEFDAN